MTEDWTSVTCKVCLFKRLSIQLTITAEEKAFLTFRENVYDYAAEKGFIGDGQIESSLIIEFILHLVQYDMVQTNREVDVTVVPEDHEDTFLDWYLFEREIKKGKTITELYIKSKKFKDDYDREIGEFIKSCVPGLRAPIWSIFTVTQELDDHLFNVIEIHTDTLYQLYAEFTPDPVTVGLSFFGKIVQFGNYSYLGSNVRIVSDADLRKSLEIINTFDYLDDRFTTFMDGKKNLSSMTLQMYEETFSLLLDYISNALLATVEQIKDIDIKKLMKWAKREYHISVMKSKQIRKIIKVFLNYL